MTKEPKQDDEFLVFVDDGETFSPAEHSAAVLRGDWDYYGDNIEWDRVEDDDFHSGIKEVLPTTLGNASSVNHL
jgi:hypothetical protein